MILGIVLTLGVLFGSSAFYQKGKIDGSYECEVKRAEETMSHSVEKLKLITECVLKK